MTKATHKCSGCGRKFLTRRGFLNHLQQSSRDPRCTSVRDRLRPTYPSMHDQETPPSQDIDAEMVDIDNTESATPPEASNQTSFIDVDISMSGSEDNGLYNRRSQSVLEEAPHFTTSPLSSHAPVVFDSDEDDSDDDGDRDHTPLHLEAETPPSPRGVSGAETEQTPRAGKFISTAQIASFDQIY